MRKPEVKRIGWVVTAGHLAWELVLDEMRGKSDEEAYRLSQKLYAIVQETQHDEIALHITDREYRLYFLPLISGRRQFLREFERTPLYGDVEDITNPPTVVQAKYYNPRPSW